MGKAFTDFPYEYNLHPALRPPGLDRSRFEKGVDNFEAVLKNS